MRNPIGSHVPVAGGLARTGPAHARELGAEAVQVFVANPRGWATTAGDPAQDEKFRAECAAASIVAYVHAPYLINFGSHTAATVTPGGKEGNIADVKRLKALRSRVPAG